MLVIGLTGGIASGKSVVADLFRSRGAAIIDADGVAREVLRPGQPALAEVLAAFGARFLDSAGRLDRRALADHIFHDPAARSALDRITHPRIRADISHQVEELRRSTSPPPVAVVVAPLLLEARAEGMVDKVLVVYAEEGERVRRLQARDGLSEGEALRRLAAQMSPVEQRTRADYVIDTTAGREATGEAFSRLWGELAGSAEAPSPQR